MYGIRCNVHVWFKSYLSDRTQCVNINGVLADTKKMTFVVPQGSVLGPTLYCLYTKRVSNICIIRIQITLNYMLKSQRTASVMNQITWKCVAKIEI